MSAMVSSRDVCPLLPEQQPECFCSNLTSQKIIQMLAYCGGRFEECAIFQRSRPAKRPSARPGAADPAAREQGEGQ
jgi:hypothetical protein